VAVEIERLVPADDPSEPCLESETVQLLREIKDHADHGDLAWLAGKGKITPQWRRPDYAMLRPRKLFRRMRIVIFGSVNAVVSYLRPSANASSTRALGLLARFFQISGTPGA